MNNRMNDKRCQQQHGPVLRVMPRVPRLAGWSDASALKAELVQSAPSIPDVRRRSVPGQQVGS